MAGYSPNMFNAALVSRVAASDLKDLILVWYDRVPSASNISDAPSRSGVPAAVPGWPVPRRDVLPKAALAGLEAIVQGSRGLDQTESAMP